MPLRNLLVHLDLGKASEARADAAIALAAAHDAHLTALVTAVTPPLPDYVAAQIPNELLVQTETETRNHIDAVEKSFRHKAEAAGINHDVFAELGIASSVGTLVLHTRHVDLAILGQADPNDPPPGEATLTEDVVLSCGRGVLVLPYIGAINGIGRHVMVAWDASREAARAIADAMPLMESAEQVTVASVRASESEQPDDHLPSMDIATHLARHGIAVEVKTFVDPGIGIGNTLLSRAADHGVDMLVMGAYGHARLRELILGGVTRDILKTMTVPVLMSH